MRPLLLRTTEKGNEGYFHDDDTFQSSFQIWDDLRSMDNELIAPELSQYQNERQIGHLWHCPECDLCFESVVSFPAVDKPMRDIKTGNVIFPSLFPSLLVA